MRPHRILPALALLCLGLLSAGVGRAEESAEEILKATGVKGGLVVHLGCGDGRILAELGSKDAFLAHGLDADPRNVAAARERIAEAGVYGSASVEELKGARLPYTDNLVNLLVADDAGKVSKKEIMRVLVPNGVAYIKGVKTVKPRPANIDEWTHYLGRADNNAVAQDMVVGQPRHMQWVVGPRFARSHEHLATVSAVVSSGGRIFKIIDEGPTESVTLPSNRFVGIPMRHGCGTSRSLQILRAVKSSTSRWRGTVEHLRATGLR